MSRSGEGKMREGCVSSYMYIRSLKYETFLFLIKSNNLYSKLDIIYANIILSHLIPNFIIPFHTISCHVVSYHIVSHHVISYHITSCHILLYQCIALYCTVLCCTVPAHSVFNLKSSSATHSCTLFNQTKFKINNVRSVTSFKER